MLAYLFESTSSGSTQLCWFLVAASHGGVLGHLLLGHLTHLPRPLLTPLGRGVALSDVLTLLILNSLATHNVIFNLQRNKIVFYTTGTKKIF